MGHANLYEQTGNGSWPVYIDGGGKRCVVLGALSSDGKSKPTGAPLELKALSPRLRGWLKLARLQRLDKDIVGQCLGKDIVGKPPGNRF